MSRRRISILLLMLLVGIAAADLALGRAIGRVRPDVLCSLAVSVLVLQYGVYRLVRDRGRSRAFWAGFLAAGCLATSSFAWAVSRPRVTATIRDQASGTMVTLTSSGAPFARQWDTYLTFADDCLETLPDGFDVLRRGGLLLALADAGIAFLPQLLLSLLGGLLFWLVARLWAAFAGCGTRRISQSSRAYSLRVWSR
jgi:hypothetical protein